MAEDKEIKTEKSNLKKGEGTILIVDDDLSIRRVLKEFLNSKGFEAHTAPLAGDAIEISNETNFDLVITNIRMPGMDGLELTRLIKSRYDWVFQTGCLAPGFTRNDWGTSRPCLFPPMRKNPSHPLCGWSLTQM